MKLFDEGKNQGELCFKDKRNKEIKKYNSY